MSNNKKVIILLIVCFMTLITTQYILSETTGKSVVTKDVDHSGHDHAASIEKKVSHDENDEEDHSGHDHAANKEKKGSHDENDGEDHSGHDHAANKEKKDSHDEDDGEDHSGHNHAAQSKKTDSHDVNDEEDHSGHDHTANKEKKGSHDVNDEEDHSGHDHSSNAESDASGIKLSEENLKRFGIMEKKATGGVIEKVISLPGEVKLNPDNVAHIVPKVSGSVIKVHKRIGDSVHSGELLAELDSIDIGKAKIDYLIKKAEVGCCTFQLSRAEKVHKNTKKLIRILKRSPSLDEVKKFESGEMGENREKLISSYADFIVSKEIYLTEKKLSGKNISSRTEFLAAQNEYKKNEAKFLSALDSADYQVVNELQEAKNTKQQQELELQSSLWTLKIYGMKEKEINNLEKVINNLSSLTNTTHVNKCKEPNCKNCKLKRKAMLNTTNNNQNNEISRYYITAPFDGTVTEKHITRGEYVENTDVFVLADLRTVWIEFSIYQKFISSVSKGTPVIISAGTKGPYIAGIIDYVSPVVDRETRTASARVVLNNFNGLWKPGMFITVMVSIENVPVKVKVERSAVVEINGKSVVFVNEGNGFVTRDVTTGKKNMDFIEITGGLKEGEKYVSKGTFDLKAHMITKNLDPHAGHGH